MAKKGILGIDIGTNVLKLAYVKDDTLVDSAVLDLPEKIVQDGHVVSVEAMGEIIQTTLKENNIKVNNAAFVLNGGQIFVRTLTVPQMSEEQLLFNIPFEFKDYITEELKDYIYDFGMISTPEEVQERSEMEDSEESSIAKTMDILAAACPKERMEEVNQIARKSSVRLVGAAPAVSAYINLIRKINDEIKEYCILDIGYDSINMDIFKGDCYKTSRKIDFGLKDIDSIIADHMNVDEHLAHTYFINNFEKCQEADYVVNACRSFVVDISRALNFYRFNNRDSQLEDVYVCGGGSKVSSIMKLLKDSLDMNVHMPNDLLPYSLQNENAGLLLQAIGIALD